MWGGRGPALVLRQAQDEGYWQGGSVENLILSLSKDEAFALERHFFPKTSMMLMIAGPRIIRNSTGRKNMIIGTVN